jgi:DNA-binding Lrp family transcriptional regulator
MKRPLDELDVRLLEIIRGNARITNRELSRALGLSESASLSRLKKLQASGIIAKYVTLLALDQHCDLVLARADVKLADQRKEAFSAFEVAVSSMPEILDATLVVGDADYLLDLWAGNLERLYCALGILDRPPHNFLFTRFHIIRKPVKRSTIPLDGLLGAPPLLSR